MPNYVEKSHTVIFKDSFIPDNFESMCNELGYRVRETQFSTVYEWEFLGTVQDFLSIIELCKG